MDEKWGLQQIWKCAMMNVEVALKVMSHPCTLVHARAPEGDPVLETNKKYTEQPLPKLLLIKMKS